MVVFSFISPSQSLLWGLTANTQDYMLHLALFAFLTINETFCDKSSWKLTHGKFSNQEGADQGDEDSSECAEICCCCWPEKFHPVSRKYTA